MNKIRRYAAYLFSVNIYIENPNEKLYMINAIDLHMLKENNMHISNDVFFRFHMSCDKN